MVKEDAPELLRQQLSSHAWKPQLIALSGNTDCYQPAEKKRQLTRRCLEVLLDFRNPVVIITKNHLVTRDIDILSELARYDCVGVTLSLTTLDHHLSSLLEPRASRPARRLAAIKALAEGGVPVGYLQAPMIPGLTDAEAPAIALAAAKAGATFSGYVALRLPFAVKSLFEQWLDQHYPDKKQKILNRVREIRSGKLNDPNFKTRMLFLDELSAGLDPVTSAELDQLVLSLARSLKITFIVVTHELPSIFTIADRVIMLDKQEKGIIAIGSPQELRDHSDDPRVHQFFFRQASTEIDADRPH